MRLIDADALIKQAQEIIGEGGGYKAWAILSAIGNAPTIEKKAKWIPIRKGERGYSAGDFRCSVCHQPNKCYTMTNYCSHCGAYMGSDK